MTPGIRGMILSLPATAPGVVTVTCNATKASYNLNAGQNVYFLPLFMSDWGIDLTIASTAATSDEIAPSQGATSSVAITATAADDFCIITSAAVLLNGVAVTVQR